MNLICNAQLSMNAYDYVRMWIRDFVQRGGDVLKLPTSKTLQVTRDKMVPSGLTVTATEARFPLQVKAPISAMAIFKSSISPLSPGGVQPHRPEAVPEARHA